eukprot:CAMPEP_0170600414 /NCGR_PEP_ID=MMETSP0224-20130122/17321_1 /TAXON_ID=285029 /ORGANISM="Togula jolla, Strain CCCM 725" /LENGTH=230 /DNA_ID=CAMNT_0010925137 /DNA_START=487 /DNA_END=1180 /DNA_ORIENTATION=-
MIGGNRQSAVSTKPSTSSPSGLSLKALRGKELDVLATDLGVRRGPVTRDQLSALRPGLEGVVIRGYLHQARRAVVLATLLSAEIHQLHHDFPALRGAAYIGLQPAGDELEDLFVADDVKDAVAGQKKPITPPAAQSLDVRVRCDLAKAWIHAPRLKVEVTHGSADRKGTINSLGATQGALIYEAARCSDPLLLQKLFGLMILSASQMPSCREDGSRIAAVRQLHSILIAA